ncbi:MAG: hypothetical protein HFJ57_05720 [Clostridia bacterium]|nr:hypothetical protein [Clostridia bacterium]
MSTCLGLYIEDNVIKYAKVSKDNDIIKIDSFGIKFYDKINEAISQVIEETYSYKIPISINLSNENYNYFYLFSMLNKKDMQNVINTEFESICYDNGLNKDAFETRYVLVNNIEDKEKVKAIHISANKADLAKKTQYLDSYRVTTASPIGIAITNIIEHQDNENYLVVNIEDRTTVTTVVDKKITDVKVIDDGTSQILSKINAKENSYLKAYEICKNTTIYTSEGKDLQYEENDYLDDIMPTLYNIVGEVRKISNESLNKIEKVYITGTASVINNIDIYFQEYLQDIKCEILKPYFINNTKAKINIKDYIEVNSPIALALQGLGEGLNGVNFKKETLKDKISEIMKIEIGGSKPKSGAISKLGSKLNMDLSFDFKERLTAFERTLLRTSLGLLMLIIVYTGISIFLNNSMNKKEEEILNATLQVNSQIKQISEDDTNIKAKTAKYVSMTQRLTDLNAKTQDKNKRKNAIPTLLNQIMFSIPKGVQITSIQNTSGTKIVINAQANTYDQLGYLKASIKNYGILTNVISDSGEKQTQDGLIKTTIEGDLPIE